MQWKKATIKPTLGKIRDPEDQNFFFYIPQSKPKIPRTYFFSPQKRK